MIEGGEIDLVVNRLQQVVTKPDLLLLDTQDEGDNYPTTPTEQLLRLYLSEMGIATRDDEFERLVGIFVYSKTRLLVLDYRLTSIQRLAQTLHTLGHIAEGHTQDPERGVIFEYRVEPARYSFRDQQVRAVYLFHNSQADGWVDNLMRFTLYPTANPTNPHIISLLEAHRELHRHRLKGTFLPT